MILMITMTIGRVALKLVLTGDLESIDGMHVRLGHSFALLALMAILRLRLKRVVVRVVALASLVILQ